MRVRTRDYTVHQFGVRFTKEPLNFISAMSGSNGNRVMERAAQKGPKVAKMAKNPPKYQFSEKRGLKTYINSESDLQRNQ